MMHRFAPAGAAAGFAVAALSPASARADIMYERQSSDISGIFELKLGTYAPDLDAEFDGPTPYVDVFDGRDPLLLELEYDRYLLRRFGSLGVYGAAGWRQVRGDAQTLDGQDSDDRTRLATLPIRLGVSYRMDELQRRWNVPLVVAVKAGLDYTLWFVRNESGVADYQDAAGVESIGRGGTTGLHIGGGAYLLLDMLAPKMAAAFDESAGVNNTYLFAEVTFAKLNDFGGANSWDLSDTMLMFGLAFEL